MSFLSDTFTVGGVPVLLSAHAPDIGGTWVKHPSFTDDITAQNAENRALTTGATSTFWYNNVTPPSADYEISCTVRYADATGGDMGVIGRASSSVDTFYRLYLTATQVKLDKHVAGTTTNLLAVAHSLAQYTDATIKLRMVGSTISAFYNGSQIAGSPVTDSSITAAGFAGIGLKIYGRVDDLLATDIAANPAPTFPGPNIANITASVGANITPVVASAKFSDTDALSFTAVGTWPTGIVVTTTGTIQGAPTTAGTYAGLTVLATDTGGNTVSSNSFTITVSASVAATITTAPLKNNAGSLLANETGATVHVVSLSGVVAAILTGQTTNSSGVMVSSSTAIASGTQYRIIIILASGAEGLAKVTAA